MGRISTRAVLLTLMALGIAPARADDRPPLEGVRRVVFLGDSITHSGQYVEFIEAYLRLKDPALRCEFLDLGLPSETVSGLSEPGHAGGQFPRPDLHERLDRVLAKAKPDLVVACYGMNDGIYYPLGEDRSRKFQDGMKALRDKAKAAGAKVLHVTPPVFDPVPLKGKTLPAGLSEYRQPYEGYDEVLTRYSDWLLSKRADGWDVVDAHGPMRHHLDQMQRRLPSYRLADDGVHINATGHWIIARQILRHWGMPLGEAEDGPVPAFAALPHGPEVLRLVRKKQELLKDAWLTEIGHKRPGMRRGLPLEEAERKAAEVDAEIGKLLAAKP
jgi:lysophospholipase L1-like esterase